MILQERSIGDSTTIITSSSQPIRVETLSALTSLVSNGETPPPLRDGTTFLTIKYS